LITHYTHGLGLTSRVASGDQAAYYDFDAVGSTVGMSGTTGTYLNLYRYLASGQTLTSSETLTNPFQFVGEFGVIAQGIGLAFMRARFYSPAEGRFLAQDPIGLAGGLNLYTYARNSLTMAID